MSQARKRRSTARWARYFNHYGHIPMVVIGGWAAVRAMNHSKVHGQWARIRHQRKLPFHHGYRIPFD